MTFLVERLAELRRHLDHLESLLPRVGDRGALQRDLSLYNDDDLAGARCARTRMAGERRTRPRDGMALDRPASSWGVGNRKLAAAWPA